MEIDVMSDVSLRQDVIDELEFEPSVNAAHIGVAVDDGVVTLSGHVASYAEKVAAEQAVKRVKGVRAIAEELDVRYPSDKKTADDEIAVRAVNILQWNAVVPASRIQLKVQNGWVTLMGEVDWQFERSAAETEIRKLSGVSGVINNITIKPKILIADVKKRIEDALKRSAEVEAQNIQIVPLANGEVILEGQVHDWQELEAAERAAWSAAGVRSVENRLTIT